MLKKILFVSLLLIFPCSAFSADKPIKVPFTDMECSAAYLAMQKELAARNERLNQREETLKSLEKELDKKMARWEILQKDLNQKIALFQEKSTEDFDNLVEVYSTMRGSKAAPLLNGMSSENAARILKAMDSEKVADIVPRLDEKKAVEVSRLMGRLK